MFKTRFISLLVLLMTAVTGAWATEVTIATNQGQTSYTSGDITISVSMVGDGDGAIVSGSWWPMIITCGDGNVLQSVVVTIGYYPENASEVTASAGSCEVSGDGNKHSTYVTVTGINASSVSIGCNGDVQIEQVVVNYGPSAPAGYAVSLKAETADEGNWTAKAGEGEYQSLPLEGVAQGTQVTLKYAGLKKVKSVKAVKKAAASLIVNPAVGQIIGSDGKNYDANATLPTGVTAAGVVVYKDGAHGLALALTDEASTMNWSTANGTTTGAAAHTPTVTGQAWKLPSEDEWKQMFNANGSNENSCAGLNTAIGNAGGTALQKGYYWSSDEFYDSEEGEYVVRYMQINNDNASFYVGGKNPSDRVRACFAF